MSPLSPRTSILILSDSLNISRVHRGFGRRRLDDFVGKVDRFGPVQLVDFRRRQRLRQRETKAKESEGSRSIPEECIS